MRTGDSRHLNQMFYRPPCVEERPESEYHSVGNSFLAYASRAATCFATFAASVLRGALPPVLVAAVCMVFGIPTITIVTYDRLESSSG